MSRLLRLCRKPHVSCIRSHPLTCIEIESRQLYTMIGSRLRPISAWQIGTTHWPTWPHALTLSCVAAVSSCVRATARSCGRHLLSIRAFHCWRMVESLSYVTTMKRLISRSTRFGKGQRTRGFYLLHVQPIEYDHSYAQSIRLWRQEIFQIILRIDGVLCLSATNSVTLKRV